MRSASVSASFKECQKKLLALRRHVATLEGGGDPGTAPSNPEGEAAAGSMNTEQAAAELDELSATLAALLKAVGTAADMDLWRRKIATAQAEQRELSASLQAVAARRRREQEEENAKKALLERRYDMDSVRLDREYKINESANNSVSMLGQYIEMGRSTVAEFRRQREILDRVHNRLIDAGQSMGLSQSLMSVIARRDFMDRLLVGAGMVVLLIVVALIWWFRKRI